MSAPAASNSASALAPRPFVTSWRPDVLFICPFAEYRATVLAQLDAEHVDGAYGNADLAVLTRGLEELLEQARYVSGVMVGGVPSLPVVRELQLQRRFGEFVSARSVVCRLR